jgi:hypothetical protein
VFEDPFAGGQVVGRWLGHGGSLLSAESDGLAQAQKLTKMVGDWQAFPTPQWSFANTEL